MSTEKETHIAEELQVLFYSGNLLRTVTQEAASQIVLKSWSIAVREEPGYRGVFAEEKKRKTSPFTTASVLLSPSYGPSPPSVSL